MNIYQTQSQKHTWKIIFTCRRSILRTAQENNRWVTKESVIIAVSCYNCRISNHRYIILQISFTYFLPKIMLFSIIVTSLLLITVIIAISYCHVSNYCVSWYILTRARHAVVFHLFRNAYFRSLVHSSRKLWPKPDNFAPFILPCKIGGSQNLMKERYLSKTPNVTFVYLSKCNMKLPSIFENSKKRFFVSSDHSC